MKNTVASGANSSPARNSSDTVMNAQRIRWLAMVSRPGREARSSWRVTGAAAIFSAPPE